MFGIIGCILFINSTHSNLALNSNDCCCYCSARLLGFKVLFGLFSPHTHPLSYQVLAAICSKFRLIGCSTFGSSTAFVIGCYSYLLLPIVLQCTMYNCFTIVQWTQLLEQIGFGTAPNERQMALTRLHWYWVLFSAAPHLSVVMFNIGRCVRVCGLVFVVCLYLHRNHIVERSSRSPNKREPKESVDCELAVLGCRHWKMSFGERATKAVEGEGVKLDCCYTCTSTTRVGWVSRVKESTCTADTQGIATHMYGVVTLECKETVVPPICPPQGFPYGTPMVPAQHAAQWCRCSARYKLEWAWFVTKLYLAFLTCSRICINLSIVFYLPCYNRAHLFNKFITVCNSVVTAQRTNFMWPWIMRISLWKSTIQKSSSIGVILKSPIDSWMQK